MWWLLRGRDGCLELCTASHISLMIPLRHMDTQKYPPLAVTPKVTSSIQRLQKQSIAATASPLAGTPGVTSSMDMLPPRSRRCILAARWMRLEKNLQGNKVVVACY